MDSKRRRSENFTARDKELLLEKVIERKEIVELKKTDGISARAKEQAWQDIASDYNASSSSPRTPVALRMCWDNMKRKCRKAYALEKMNSFKAGNKKHCVIQSDPLLDKVKDILSFDGLCNYDSYAMYHEGSDSHNASRDIKEEYPSDFGSRKANSRGQTGSSCSEYSPYRLKRSATDSPKNTEKRSSKTSPYIQTLTSESSESETRDLEETETFVHATSSSSQSCSSKRNKPTDTDLVSGNEMSVLAESLKIVPYVQRLTTETTSEGETPHEDSSVSKANNNRNNFWRQPRRRPHQINSLADMLTESKLELAKLAKEHAISEERRREEFHELQIEEIKLKMVERKKRIALHDLRSQETELEIELLKARLQNEVYY